MARHYQILTAALALLFLGAHIAALPRSLEDIDSINFALGVESFDVAQHRPHPPGYPVFVAMGKASTRLVAAVAPGIDRTRRAAIGLAIWNVAAGTVFVWVLFGFWRAIGWEPRAAWCAAAFGIVSPLFWFTSARPLTDAVALVGAVAVQGVLVARWTAVSEAARVEGLIAAAFAAGLLIGVRTQTMWLTGPLLVCLVVRDLWAVRWRRAAAAVGAAALGCLAWAVPLVVSTGGFGAYVTALGEQGREDFSGIEMLATSAGGHLVRQALSATFIAPWRLAWLGQLASGLAIVGVVGLIARRRPVAGLVAIAFGPYLAFHLAFHETATVRYALPVVIGMAGLAMRAVWWLPVRAAAAFATVVIVAAFVTAQQSLGAYATNVPPTFLAFAEAEAAARGATPAPFVVSQVGVRRVSDWFRPVWPALPPSVPGEASWLAVVDHFRDGGVGPVWFMTDRRRTDALLFDHRTRRVVGEVPGRIRKCGGWSGRPGRTKCGGGRSRRLDGCWAGAGRCHPTLAA